MNLDNDNDFDEDDPDTIIPVRLWLGIVNLKNKKHIKQVNEWLMLVAWHPKWYNFYMSEVEKKRDRTKFYWKMLLVYISSTHYGSIGTDCYRKVYTNTEYS